MTPDVALDIVYDALMTILISAAPPLLMGLVVGVTFSILQTITSIQEPTLAFIPKIVAVLLALIIFGPFILSNLLSFITRLLERVPEFLVPR